MEEDECINEFRVRKCDLPILVDVLRNPNEIICDQSSVVGGVEALCMLLKRLTYPCRYSDMMQRFGHRQVPVLCMATNSMLDYIYAEHHQRITQWNDNILNPAALETYADSIHQMGAPLENCFGFIDGTVRPIARPGITQRILYNGHKRIHSLKYQAVAIPNGLIAHLYGPVEGRKHDSGMLAESGLMSLLENPAMSADGHPMCGRADAVMARLSRTCSPALASRLWGSVVCLHGLSHPLTQQHPH
ncbi:Retrovirus-related Pol polyprotein from transposon 412 [Labeo rohita]|uniref:Retrovirus-related Pol polyprotein from transposon 412 n=1 Tax=Labeo rohita TaxID=84645 RepID=A0A498P0G6_LABRO|nr:Retrovirus-related Pol polyprotein from transposon 412 [Labeo rohita]